MLPPLSPEGRKKDNGDYQGSEELHRQILLSLQCTLRVPGDSNMTEQLQRRGWAYEDIYISPKGSFSK